MGAVVGIAGPGAESEAVIERQVAVMGTTLDLTVTAADRAVALLASEAAVRAVEAVESRLSTWRVDSQLSRLNRAALGAPFHPSPELAGDLTRVLHWLQETDGAFQPGVAALVEAWALRRGGRRPTTAQLTTALAACAKEAITFDLPSQVIRHRPGAGIEEGGFGKGVALDAAGQALLSSGATHAFLDFGGQTLVVGESSESHAVSVALADPRDRTLGVLRLALGSGSTATSGNSERGLVVDGERLGHILDPRTGRPSRDFGTLTVWTGQAVDADCLSTGLYVLGPDAALAFAQARPTVEVIVLETNGESLRARATDGLRGRLSSLDPELTLEWHSPAKKEAP